MTNKSDILKYFKGLCEEKNKKLSRDEYRKIKPLYSSSLIENIWGNWTNFTEEADFNITRHENKIIFDKTVRKVVITYISDGADLNLDAYETLLNYCNNNDIQFGILWGKAIKKNATFSELTYKLISKYLATSFEFEINKNCMVKDYLIPHTQKNPLLNLDKLSTNLRTIVVGSNKQYLKVLPYKQYEEYRVACSTGTIGNPDYKDTVAGNLDNKYHTFGGILLEYDDQAERFTVRNLIYKDGEICDLNKIYTKKSVKEVKNVPAMVLGDLHLPDEDDYAMRKTLEMLNKWQPNYVMIHDVASWNSISHHDEHNYLNKNLNRTGSAETLEREFSVVTMNISHYFSNFENIQFKLVRSNHDAFIEKWLNAGEFIKDKQNAKMGCRLYEKYLENGNILDGSLPKNVSLLKRNSSFRINGFELAEHGDEGIAGSKGNPATFSRGFEKIVIGHTHSPEINQSTCVVGTLSALKLCYNQKGMTNWAHANGIIHKNGTFQLIFI